jgi:hypothetical protein
MFGSFGSFGYICYATIEPLEPLVEEVVEEVEEVEEIDVRPTDLPSCVAYLTKKKIEILLILQKCNKGNISVRVLSEMYLMMKQGEWPYLNEPEDLPERIRLNKSMFREVCNAGNISDEIYELIIRD